MAVIKFCPQQGHRCFHGNGYTLKPRKMTVEKKSIKKAKRLATVAFHVLTEERELWNPGAGVEFMRPPKSYAIMKSV